MVDRLWVPVSQVLRARSWNSPSSGWPFTASRVASSVAVSTPLRGWCAVVVMIPPGVGAGGPSGGGGAAERAAMSGAGSAAEGYDGRPAPHRTRSARRRPHASVRALRRSALLLVGPAAASIIGGWLMRSSSVRPRRTRWPTTGRSAPRPTRLRSWSVWEAWARSAACLRRAMLRSQTISAARSSRGVTGGWEPSNHNRTRSLTSPQRAWKSGVTVAYQSRFGCPALSRASVAQDDTVRWSSCPVIPSGPNVTMVVGRSSSMNPAMRSTAVVPVCCGESTVGIAQPVVLGDAEDGQARAELPFADGGQPVRRPAVGVVRALFATGGGEHDHAVSRVAGGGHQGGGEERLVVGMGPDAEQCAGRGSGRVWWWLMCSCPNRAGRAFLPPSLTHHRGTPKGRTEKVAQRTPGDAAAHRRVNVPRPVWSRFSTVTLPADAFP